MNKMMTSNTKRVMLRGVSLVACIVVLAMHALPASPAVAATTLPVLWTAGGLSESIDSAGQAGRIAADASGNVAPWCRDRPVGVTSPSGRIRRLDPSAGGVWSAPRRERSSATG